MKNLKYFIALVICSIGLKQNVYAQNFNLFFQEQYSPDRTQLWVDVMIRTTSGAWNLGSANFVVNFDETVVDYLGRDETFDGPWDNDLNSTYYLNMSSLGIKILGDSCVNLTVNPKTSACSSDGNGVEVPNTGVRIARLKFSITCGTNPGIAWKTGPGTGTINKWNTDCSITNIKANANFIDPPVIGGFTDNDPVCADGNYELTIINPQTGYVYRAYKNGDYTTELGTWSSPNITIPASSLTNGDEITVRGINTSGSDSIIYVVGCFDEVEIDPAITSAVLSSDSSVCGSGPYPIRVVTITGGVGPYSLTFDRDGDSSSDTTITNYTAGNDISIFFSGTTTYDLLSITDANGCELNGSPIDGVTITVNPTITSAVLSSDSSVCGSGPYPIRVVTITGGVGPYSLTFDRDGDSSSDTTITNYTAGNDISIFFSGTTTYDLLSITDANGCVLNGLPIDGVTITVNPTITSAVLSSDSSVCGSGPYPIRVVTITGGVGPYSLSFDRDGDSSSDTTITNYTAGNDISIFFSGTTTYDLLSITDANGCELNGSPIDGVTITVNPTITSAVLSSDSSVCGSGPYPIRVVTITGGVGPYSLSFDRDGDSSSDTTITNYTAGNDISIFFSGTTTYDLLSITDANGCELNGLPIDGVTITVNPTITSAVLSSDSSVCGSGPYPIRVVTITGGVGPYSLTFDRDGDSSSDTTITNYTAGNDISIFFSGTTTYDLLSITDANGCVLNGLPIDGVTITVNPAITSAVLSSDSSVCGSGPYPIRVVTITGGVGPYSLTFDRDGDSSSDTTITNYTAGNDISIFFSGTTTYDLLSITDANGCVLNGLPIDGVTITVNPTITSAVLSSDSSVCGSGPYPIRVVTITGGVGPYSLTFDRDGDSSSDTTITNYTAGNDISIFFSGTTTYDLLSITDANGCELNGSPIDGVTITVNPTITSAVLSSDSSVCGSGPYPIRVVTITGGVGPYSLSFDRDGDSSSDTTITNYTAGNDISIFFSGTTTYDLLSITDANGCELNGSPIDGVTITVNPTITSAVLSSDSSVCGSGPYPIRVVTITGGVGPYSLTFDRDGDSSSDTTITNYTAGNDISIFFSGTTTYDLLSITDANGCELNGLPIDGVTITVNPTITSAVLSSDSSVCGSGPYPIRVVTITGGVGPYSLTFDRDGDSSSDTTITNYTAGNDISIFFSGTTTYDLLSITDANGCELNGSPIDGVTITVNPTITSAVLSSDSSVCGSGPYPIRVVTITGGVGPYSLSFDRDGDSSSDTTITNYTAGNDISIFFSGTTTYDLLSITDANGCELNGSPIDGVTITVNPDNTITLSSSVGTDDQTVCLNSAITNITYITTGATGANFTGLPVGVTGNFSVGNITISGTPTATGTFNYTITLLGGCGTVTASGTITVNPGFSFSSPTPASVCLNDIVHLTLDMTVPGASWSVSSPSHAEVVLSNDDEAYIQFKSGATSVTVTVTGGACSINHNFTVNQTVKIDLKALLNGANDGSGGMNANIITDLENVYENGIGSTPYAGSLLGALGTSGAMEIPDDGGAGDAVDVVQIELRDDSDPSNIVATTYGFIMADGDVRDFPGGASTYAAISDVNFCGVPNGNYYVVVKHRNHLPIRSANPITLSNSNSFTFGVVSLDLTNPANVYNSSFGFCNIDAGKAYMWEGNVYDDASTSDLGEVNATDFFLVSTENDNGATGYVTEDVDLDGDVDADDFNIIQNGNNNLYFTDIPNPQLNHP